MVLPSPVNHSAALVMFELLTFSAAVAHSPSVVGLS